MNSLCTETVFLINIKNKQLFEIEPSSRKILIDWSESVINWELFKEIAKSRYDEILFLDLDIFSHSLIFWNPKIGKYKNIKSNLVIGNRPLKK